MNLRKLQTRLPWTVRYSRDFRANPQSHKDFAHSLVHVQKALGYLAALVDDMDHDRDVADSAENVRQKYEKYIADLVVCALRAANTFPGGVIDLERAVIDRLETKNGIKLERGTQSEPLTFGELGEGDHFISFPLDGDDSGHGGFRAGSRLFTKLDDECARAGNGTSISRMPATMRITKVI